MNKNQKTSIFLVLIIATAALVRLPLLLNKPILGNFSSYQVVLASISHFILTEGFQGILCPKYHILLNGTPSLHMLNFPIISVLAAAAVKIGGGTIHGWGYFISTGFTLLSCLLLFFIIRRHFDERIALLTCTLFVFSPLTLVFGSRFFNEPIALFFLLLSFYLLSLTGSGKRDILYAFFSGLAFSIAGTSRYHFYVLLPAWALLIFTQPLLKKRVWILVIFLFVSISPVLIWTAHTQSVAAKESHLDQVHTALGQVFGERYFSSAHLTNLLFYKRVFNGVVEEWFTAVFFPFLIFGFFSPWEKRHWAFPAWGFLSLVLCFVLPEKFHDHWFYTYPFIPVGALLVGLSFSRLILDHPSFSHGVRWRWVLFFLITVSGVAIARVYVPAALAQPPNLSELLKTAAVVSSHTAENSRIVILENGESMLLYYANRSGWILNVGKEAQLKRILAGETQAFLTKRYVRDIKSYLQINNVDRLRQFIAEGATHLVAVDKNEISLDSQFSKYVQDRLKLLSDPKESYAIYGIQGSNAGEMS